MSIRPIALAASLTAVVGLMLTGCGSASSTESVPSTAPTAAPSPTVEAAATETGTEASTAVTPVPVAVVKPVKKEKVRVTVEPGPGRTVGIGYPIIVRFSHPVKDKYKADVQAGLSVSVNKPTDIGSWAWISDDSVYYRPKTYWPGNARITVSLDLDGVVMNKKKNTEWVGGGKQDRDVTFKTGKAVISYVNANTKRMKVTVNGETVKVFPVSLGKPGWETRSGIKVVHEKYEAKRMTSQALGLTNETYDLIAPYSVRITPTGEFVHGAPWAYGRMGRYNGSHGCTNMYSQDAKWFFYNAARPGDVVVTKGTNKKMETWNGLGGPWNYSWKKWLKMSAIPGSQSSPGPVETTPAPVPAPSSPTATPAPTASASPSPSPSASVAAAE